MRKQCTTAFKRFTSYGIITKVLLLALPNKYVTNSWLQPIFRPFLFISSYELNFLQSFQCFFLFFFLFLSPLPLFAFLCSVTLITNKIDQFSSSLSPFPSFSLIRPYQRVALEKSAEKKARLWKDNRGSRRPSALPCRYKGKLQVKRTAEQSRRGFAGRDSRKRSKLAAFVPIRTTIADGSATHCIEREETESCWKWAWAYRMPHRTIKKERKKEDSFSQETEKCG